MRRKMKALIPRTFAAFVFLCPVTADLANAQACDGAIVKDICLSKDQTRLNISYRKFKDVYFLSEVPALEYLDMGFNPVHDLSPLRQLRKLMYLDLSEMRLDDEALDLTPLTDLIALTELNISENNIDHLSALSDLSKLKVLIAFGTDIKDLAPLASLQNLRVLHLQDTLVSDLSPLVGLLNLEGLYLNGTAVLDVTVLQRLPNLQALGLPNGSTIMGQDQIQNFLSK